jgi:class 3 adenylate cyclase
VCFPQGTSGTTGTTGTTGVQVQNADGNARVDIYVLFAALPASTLTFATQFLGKLVVFLDIRADRVVLVDAVESSRTKIMLLSLTIADDPTDIRDNSFSSVCAESVLERLRLATAKEMFLAGLGNVTHLQVPVLNSRCSVSGAAVQQIQQPSRPESESEPVLVWLIVVAVLGGVIAAIGLALIAVILYRNHRAIKERLMDGAPVGDVFLVFTDIQSSTELWDTMEEVFRACLQMHDAKQRELIGRCAGYEVKTEGDAFLVSFHSAEDAVHFALLLQLEMMSIEWPEELFSHPACAPVQDPRDQSHLIYNGIRVRVGIHAGSDYGDDPNIACSRNHQTLRMDYSGRAINRCGRVQGLAPGGAIFVTSEVIADLESTKSDLLWRTDYSDDNLDKALADGALGVFSALGMFRLRELHGDTAIFVVAPTSIAARPLPNPRHIPGFRNPETGEYFDADDAHVNQLALGSAKKPKKLGKIHVPAIVAGLRSPRSQTKPWSGLHASPRPGSASLASPMSSRSSISKPSPRGSVQPAGMETASRYGDSSDDAESDVPLNVVASETLPPAKPKAKAQAVAKPKAKAKATGKAKTAAKPKAKAKNGGKKAAAKKA